MVFTNYYSKVNCKELCLADSVTTHTIPKDNKYLSHLTLVEVNVHKILGPVDLIEGSGRENIMLSRGTTFMINDALFSSRFIRNLLSFKDIRRNGYHIETKNEDNIEYLYILMSSQDGSKYWKNYQLSLRGYIIHVILKLNHIQ